MLAVRIISGLIALGMLAGIAGARCIVPGTPTQELKRADAVFSAEVVGSK